MRFWVSSFPRPPFNVNFKKGASDSEKVILGKALSSLARLYGDTPAPSILANKVLGLVKACPSSVHLLEGAASILKVSPYVQEKGKKKKKKRKGNYRAHGILIQFI
jgi:hypothetical protein